MQRRGDDAVAAMPEAIGKLPRTTIPLASAGLMGVDSLRQVGQPSTSKPAMSAASIRQLDSYPDGLGSLIDELAAVGHGVILAMGKGGVGKTTVAAAVAVALAERGFDVHLSTTDPAAHVAATIAADEIAGLTVGRIDPAKETADYTDEVMQTAGADLDAEGKALLEEDLRSPCTEEIAVFRAFAKAVSEGQDRFVVLDTAPTGHTILLLDSALAYHREVSRQTTQIPESVENLLPRLRDPEFTRVLVVTLPEATPVHEAAKLQEDLRRAEIEPFAWVINQSLVPLEVTDPTLQACVNNTNCRSSTKSSSTCQSRRLDPLASRSADRPRRIATHRKFKDSIGARFVIQTEDNPRTRNGKEERFVSLHGQFVPQPDGRRLGTSLSRRHDRAYSAGIEAHGMNPNAMQVMKEAGVDISGQSSKLADTLKDVPLDLVITVCGHADENCPAFLSKAKVVHVGFDDPPKLAKDAASEEEALDHYRRVRDEIRDFIRDRLPGML